MLPCRRLIGEIVTSFGGYDLGGVLFSRSFSLETQPTKENSTQKIKDGIDFYVE